MPREEIITGIDIGSSNIRIAVGQFNPGEAKVHILGVAENETEGVSKGSVTSIEEAVSSISGALEKAERMIGFPIERALVGINGTHIISQESHGVVAVSKADGEIREDDIGRVVEAAQAIATPPNYEILHVIPRSFTVDNQRGIKDPVGMTGIRLEVDAQIIQGLSSQIKNLTKAIYRTSVDIDDLVFGVLAAAEAVVTKRQKELGVALVNIGMSTSSMMVFEEGDVLHTAILPVGAGHITNDIAIGLRTSIEVAEKVKLEFGSALPEEINKREGINLEEISPAENAVIPRKHVAEIIEARLEEIFKLVNKELQKINRSGLLPAGIILTGGGAKLPGLIEVAKKEFRLPAAIGYPQGIVSAIDRVNDPAYTTAVGLVIWGIGLTQQGKGGGSFIPIPGRDRIKDGISRFKKLFKSIIP